MTPKLLFEDNHLIVLAKPAGLLSQGENTGDENLVDWLRTYLKRNYVGLVHRLDRNTSGLMVVGKRTKAARRLTEALQGGELDRQYLGWVVGKVTEPQVWEHWLVKDEATNTTRAYPAAKKPGSHSAKLARLRVAPLRQANYQGTAITLIEFILETGRSHQIRAQAAAEGLPLLGDSKYGPNGPPFVRTALHSHRLTFPHPMSGEIMKFEEELPEDLRIG